MRRHPLDNALDGVVNRSKKEAPRARELALGTSGSCGTVAPVDDAGEAVDSEGAARGVAGGLRETPSLGPRDRLCPQRRTAPEKRNGCAVVTEAARGPRVTAETRRLQAEPGSVGKPVPRRDVTRRADDPLEGLRRRLRTRPGGLGPDGAFPAQGETSFAVSTSAGQQALRQPLGAAFAERWVLTPVKAMCDGAVGGAAQPTQR